MKLVIWDAIIPIMPSLQCKNPLAPAPPCGDFTIQFKWCEDTDNLRLEEYTWFVQDCAKRVTGLKQISVNSHDADSIGLVWHVWDVMFSLICAWTNGWAINGDVGDLGRHCAHYDVTVMDHQVCHMFLLHYNDVMISAMASQITNLTIVYSAFI